MKAWIYFAQSVDGGPIKIGRAHDPLRRMRELSLLSPVRIVLLGTMISEQAVVEEKTIHGQLQAHRIRGEWFEADAALVEMQRHADRLTEPHVLPTERQTRRENKESRIDLRLSHEQRVAYYAAAAARSISFSAWVREACEVKIAEEEQALKALEQAP
jgi:predicted DNA binding CopG/RHH family protein